MRKNLHCLMKLIVLVSLTIVIVIGIVGVHTYMRCREASALIQAIENEDQQKVEELLQGGADPNATTLPISRIWSLFEMSPQCPLSVACGIGNLEIVQLLLTHGATADGVEGTGFSPLEKTLFYFHPNDVKIVSLLLENGATVEEDAVFQAAQMFPRVYDKTKENGTVFQDGYDEESAKGITEIVKMLLNGRSVNSTTSSGTTLLMWSVKRENLYLTEYLVAAGSDLSVMDADGKTAYDYAVDRGFMELAEILKP